MMEDKDALESVIFMLENEIKQLEHDESSVHFDVTRYAIWGKIKEKKELIEMIENRLEGERE
jgi:hypothetical protein